jgi:hypothetical protein
MHGLLQLLWLAGLVHNADHVNGVHHKNLPDDRRDAGKILAIFQFCRKEQIRGCNRNEYPLHAFVNLEQMARYHGVLNSVGFGLCSLLGWTFLRRRGAL